MKTSKKTTPSKNTIPSKRTKTALVGILQDKLIWQILVLIFMAFLLYGQTIRNGYMLDDRLVITENSVVKQGVSGIPTLLTHDSFYGFDNDLGRTGQRKTYRPLSFVMFAVEWQFFPNMPVAGHIVHVILYAGLGVVLLFLLRRLFRASSKEKNGSFLTEWLPFGAALLFVVHPIHTEVVNNIKSRDEILALLCALGSLLLLIKSIDTTSPKLHVTSVLLFGLALLSKESA